MAMAVKSPLMPSPSGLASAFSPYSNSPTSSSSSPKSSRPRTAPPDKFLATSSPLSQTSLAVTEIVDASPVVPSPSSNGTEVTDISEGTIESGNSSEAEVGEKPEDLRDSDTTPTPASMSVTSPTRPELAIMTNHPRNHALRPRSDEDEAPQSVIHAPPGFAEFTGARRSPPLVRAATSPPERRGTRSPASQKSDATIKSPAIVEIRQASRKDTSPISPPPITTSVQVIGHSLDRPTPRAQTRQEVELFERRPPSSLEGSRLRFSMSPDEDLTVVDIPEGQDAESNFETEHDLPGSDMAIGHFQDTADELHALKAALHECWTLCNTLASLSHIHRERLWNFSGKGDMQEQAWKSCWKLCQKLYESRDEDSTSQVRPTLDLCRDFCQALFEARVRDDDVADSVLRVSFELNNHLYNTHDRTLPEAFRERTLDFYITLCHRLMKQRTRLEEETDSLLRACWGLAEMLFSLRQNRREGKSADEELLGSAVQACWELCDLFREGWTQIRPDRGTPRPSQTTFTQAFNQAKRGGGLATVDETPAAQPSKNKMNTTPEMAHQNPEAINPETPTTIFEDTTNESPDDPLPNIIVLGPNHKHNNTSNKPPKWSSAASTLSDYSQASEQTTSSANTVTTPSEDPNLTCLKVLIIRAAMNAGYRRGEPTPLPTFVKSLSPTAFGTLPWQTSLLDSYCKLTGSDPAFRVVGPPMRVAAVDVASAVEGMVNEGSYIWLRDLYRLVFGFGIEAVEAGGKKGVTIQT